METKMKEVFEIENRIEALSVLAGEIEDLAEKWELPMPLTMSLNLVLEEAVSNVIFYAFNDHQKHLIQISFALENKILTVEIVDDGIPFDPLSQKLPDITLPVEERPIGGLGILLILKIMDQVSYSRQNNQNRLTLVKNI
ncbi:MAG: ATP-binding protein [Bacteroidales bacterium]|nr:ATP-binding protein [Bacteroidales bacterium]